MKNEKTIIETLNDIIDDIRNCNLNIFKLQCKNFIQETIKNRKCVHTMELLDLAYNEFKMIDFENDDYDSALEDILNSTCWNYILLKNGESYYVGDTILSFEYLFTMVDIDDNEEIWNSYFRVNGEYHTLYDIEKMI